MSKLRKSCRNPIIWVGIGLALFVVSGIAAIPRFFRPVESNLRPRKAPHITQLPQNLSSFESACAFAEENGSEAAIKMVAFQEPVREPQSDAAISSQPLGGARNSGQSDGGPEPLPVAGQLEDRPICPEYQEETRSSESGTEEPSSSKADRSITSFIQRIGSAQLTHATHQLNWSLDDALNAALVYSNEAHRLQLGRLASYQDVGIRTGRFDVTAFFRANYIDSSTPVGNTFQAIGAIDRIRGEEFTSSHGIRKELVSGGQIEISETNISRDDNSGILQPADQARSVLSLRFSKELLRGSGKSIATNQVLVAQLNAESVDSDSVARLTSLVKRVSDAWWGVFEGRGQLLSAIDAVSESDKVLQELMHRREIDADPDSIEQARTASYQQRLLADVAFSNLVKMQFQLIRLVNAPELLENRQMIEIHPVDVDVEQLGLADVASRQNTAIHTRPEVRKILQDIRRSQLLHHFSINQLLPRLQFSTGANFEGLSGNRDFSAAARNRFDTDATYQLAVNFEMPLGNREARFRKRKVELELAALEAQWKDTIELVKKDVLDAAQDLSVSQKRMLRQQEISTSLEERLSYLLLRQNQVPKETDIRSVQLSQLLSVLAAVARSKSNYSSALAERGRSLINMNRATGILVQPTSPSLQDPGQHQFVKIYHQFIEGKRDYRQFAESTVSNTWLISKQLPKRSRRGRPTRQPAPHPEALISGETTIAETRYRQVNDVPLQEATQGPIIAQPLESETTYSAPKSAPESAADFSQRPIAQSAHLPSKSSKRQSSRRMR